MPDSPLGRREFLLGSAAGAVSLAARCQPSRLNDGGADITHRGIPMKNALFLCALLPTLAWSAPFDGTWTVAQDSMKIVGKPRTYLLAGGMFTCGPCAPPFKVKADGNQHKVVGHAYNYVSVSVLDANTLELKVSVDDKPWGERKFVVSADGKTLTDEWVIHEGAESHSGKESYTRIAPVPAGAASVSGSWTLDSSASTIHPQYPTVTYSENADGLKMTSPNGQSFDAKFDGKQVVTEGDPDKTIALKRVNSRTIEETDRRKGRITDIIITKISRDGRTLFISDKDPGHAITTSYKASKQ